MKGSAPCISLLYFILVTVLIHCIAADTYTNQIVSTITGAQGKVAPGDIDGDGDQDLAVPGPGNSVYWLENMDGAGDFGVAVRTHIADFANAVRFVETHDFDGDGQAEIFVVTDAYVHFSVFDPSTRTFTYTVMWGAAYNDAVDVAFGDLNGDGIDDMAICSEDSTGTHGLQWWDGASNFQTLTIHAVYDYCAGLEIVDVDKDGLMDIAIMARKTAAANFNMLVDVFYNDNSLHTTYTRVSQSYLLTGDGARDLTIADIDEDGDLDFVYRDQSMAIRWISWTGTARTAGVASSGHAIPTSMYFLADIDNDGDLDWVVDGSFYENTGVGVIATLVAGINIPIEPAAVTPHLLDLNGDKLLELTTSVASMAYIYAMPELAETSISSPGAISDMYGCSIAYLGDINGDYISDIVVGACKEDGSGVDVGGIWFHFLDASGSPTYSRFVGQHSEIDSILSSNLRFGHSVATIGDLDGNGVIDLAVGSPYYNGNEGRVWILSLEANETAVWVDSWKEISYGELNLSPGDQFGYSVTGIGDVDSDGVPDLAVGANQPTGTGYVWILYLKADGSVRWGRQLDTDNVDGLLSAGDEFGASLAYLDTTTEEQIAATARRCAAYIAVGAPGTAGGGALWILFLDFDGDVNIYRQIGGMDSDWSRGNNYDLSARFGAAVTAVGDSDGNKYVDIVVAATSQDNPNTDQGRLYLLTLDYLGAVQTSTIIHGTILGASAELGTALASMDPEFSPTETAMLRVLAGSPVNDQIIIFTLNKFLESVFDISVTSEAEYTETGYGYLVTQVYKISHDDISSSKAFNLAIKSGVGSSSDLLVLNIAPLTSALPNNGTIVNSGAELLNYDHLPKATTASFELTFELLFSANYGDEIVENVTIEYDTSPGGWGTSIKIDQTFSIKLNYSSNDAPSLQSNQFVFAALEGSSASLDTFSLEDTDFYELYDDGLLTTTLVSVNATFQSSYSTGINVIDGSIAGDYVVFRAALVDCLGYLNGLSATGIPGNATISVTVNDEGNSGVGGAKESSLTLFLITLETNSGPIISAPTIVTGVEDVWTNITGVTISDADAGTNPISLIMESTDAFLNFSQGSLGVTAIIHSDYKIEFIESVSILNQIPEYVRIYPPLNYNFQANGAETITFTVDDLGNVGSGGALSDTAIVSVQFAAVNDNPLCFSPDNVTAYEDSVTYIDGLSVVDVDVTEQYGAYLSLILSVEKGLISVNSSEGLFITQGTGTEDSYMEIQGSPNTINQAIAGLNYIGDVGNAADDVIHLSLSDYGNTGTGQVVLVNCSTSVAIESSNDAPILTVPDSVTCLEDEFGFAANITFSDADIGSNPCMVTVSISAGVFSLYSTEGLTFLTGDGINDNLVVFTAYSNYSHQALSNITLKAASDFNGFSTIVTVTVSDQGFSGSGGVKTAEATFPVYRYPVNDPPTLTVGTPIFNTDEDTSVTVTGTSFADPDSSEQWGSLAQASLRAENGTVEFGKVDGGQPYQFLAGSPDTPSSYVLVEGSFDALTEAISRIVYTPLPNYHGSDEIDIWVSDQGYSGLGPIYSLTDKVDITINSVSDPLVVSAPETVTFLEDVQGHLYGISVSNVDDLDASATAIQVFLFCEQGTVHLAGAYGSAVITADPSNQKVNVTGLLSEVNVILGNITYKSAPDFNVECCGHDVIVTRSQYFDGAKYFSDKAKTFVKVLAANDLPYASAATMSGSLSVLEDEELILENVVFSDIDVHETAASLMHVQLSVSNGTLNVASSVKASGMYYDLWQSRSYQVTFTSWFERLPYIMARIKYSPNPDFFGHDTLVVTIDDLGNTGDASVTFATTEINIDISAVNDPPTLITPELFEVVEDTPSRVQINITDDSTLQGVTISASCLHCYLGLVEDHWLNVTSPGSAALNGTQGTLHFTAGGGASQTAVFEYFLLEYRATRDWNSARNGNDTVTFNVTDSAGNTRVSTMKVRVAPVNDAPIVTIPLSAVTTEDVALYIPGISVYDPDVGDVSGGVISVLIEVGYGTVSLNSTAGLYFIAGTGEDDTFVEFEGSQDNVNLAIDNLKFTPQSDFTGTGGVTLQVGDKGSYGAGGAAFENITVAIDVQADNDPPKIDAQMFVNGIEDEDLMLTFTIADVDSQYANLTLLMTCDHGAITLPNASSVVLLDGTTATLSTEIKMIGTQYAINRAVDKLTFIPDPGYNGLQAGIDIFVDDLGNKGGGPNGTASTRLPIYIQALNDPPYFTFGQGQRIVILEDNQLDLQIDVFDADIEEAYSGMLTFRAEVDYGTMTLGYLEEFAFLEGDGESDSIIEIEGDLDAVKTALFGMVYDPIPNWQGLATIMLDVSDNGGFGFGGAQSIREYIFVNVSDSSDALTAVLPSFETDEDTVLTISGVTFYTTEQTPITDNVTVVASVIAGSLNISSSSPGLPGGIPELWIDGDGSGKTISFFGKKDVVLNGINSIHYIPEADWAGLDTLTVDVTYPAVGAGGLIFASSESVITVASVNDYPVITAPSYVQVVGNTEQFLCTVVINDLELDNDDSNLGIATVNITSPDGDVRFGSRAGLRLIEGESDFSGRILRVSGGIEHLRTAMQNMYFTRDETFEGNTTIIISVGDSGYTGIPGPRTATHEMTALVRKEDIAITIEVDFSIQVAEDDSTTISIPLTVTNPSEQIEVILSVEHGYLSLNSGACQNAYDCTVNFLQGDGTLDRNMVFTSSMVNASAEVSTILYTPFPDYNGKDTLTFAIQDSTNLQGVSYFDITVAPVNDAPTIHIHRDNVTVYEDNFVEFMDNWVGDVDVDETYGAVLELTVSCTEGFLSFRSSRFLNQLEPDVYPYSVSQPDQWTYTHKSFVFSGSVGLINTLLDSLTYRAPSQITTTTDFIDFAVSDGGNSGAGGTKSASESIEVTLLDYNDPPVIHMPEYLVAPFYLQLDEDSTVTLVNISISDEDAGASDLEATITSQSGLISLSPTAVPFLSFSQGDGISDAVMTFRGSLVDINAAFLALVFQPNADYNGHINDDIVISISDQENSLNGGIMTDEVAISVKVNKINDPPVLTVPLSYTVSQGSSTVFSGINVADVDLSESFGGLMYVDIVTNAGFLSMTRTERVHFVLGTDSKGVDISGVGRFPTYTQLQFYGSIEGVNIALATLALEVPAATPCSSVISITFSIDDQGNTPGGPLSDSGSIPVTVTC